MFKIKSLTSCKTIEFALTLEINRKITTIASVMIGKEEACSLGRMPRKTWDTGSFVCKNYFNFTIVNECHNSTVLNGFRHSLLVSLSRMILPLFLISPLFQGWLGITPERMSFLSGIDTNNRLGINQGHLSKYLIFFD